MAAPSKNPAFPPYPANNPHCPFPSQNQPAYTSQYHASEPTSAPTTSPFPASYDGLTELSPHEFGTYTSPSPHGVPLFNAELHSQQLSLQERDLSYQHSSSLSPSEEVETYGDFSPTYATAPPSSTATTPFSQTPDYHLSHPCHNFLPQTWESGNPFAPTTFALHHEERTPVTYLTTTSPTTSTPTPVHQGQEKGGFYIGTPSTPPSPLHPHVSSPDLTTPTTEALVRYRNAQDTPLTPLFYHTSTAVISPMSEAGSEFGGVPVGEVENKDASEVVHRLMADQEGTSRFPASLTGWAGFETPIEEKSGQGGREGEELISPRTTTTTTHTFKPQETPQYAETPSPLAPAHTHTSPLTSPPVRRTYQNSNAYRQLVPPPGPLSPLPPAPRLPLPEPRYSEDYSINADDLHVARARQLLEEHMKNRWGSVLSANQALQAITGTTGLGSSVNSSKAHMETAAATLMHIKNRVPQPRPLSPGFGTPMQAMQRVQAERVGRGRSLSVIYEEYFLRPGARAVELCSLSIHAVSGSFGNASGGGSGGSSTQPAKLQNELLAHFTASEGGTAIQFVEIDIPNPTGSYNRHPFERWAFFAIAVPMVCGPGGVDKGFVGSCERGSIFIAAPLCEVAGEGKAVQDVLGDGRGCLRRDFVFGPGVAHRVEFWEKYGRWVDVGRQALGREGGEWICAEVEGVEGRMEGWEGGEGVIGEAVRRDVERWGRVRRAMEGGVCRIVTRVVEREGKVEGRRRERGEDGGDWEREGVRVVEGGSSVKKPRRGR